MFPYSHEVLNALVSALNAVLEKVMLLQQPESSSRKLQRKLSIDENQQCNTSRNRNELQLRTVS